MDGIMPFLVHYDFMTNVWQCQTYGMKYGKYKMVKKRRFGTTKHQNFITTGNYEI